VTLTATVSAVAPATGIPTGTVTFRDGATVLSTVTLVNGQRFVPDRRVAVGSHPLTATYNGSATFSTKHLGRRHADRECLAAASDITV